MSMSLQALPESVSFWIYIVGPAALMSLAVLMVMASPHKTALRCCSGECWRMFVGLTVFLSACLSYTFIVMASVGLMALSVFVMLVSSFVTLIRIDYYNLLRDEDDEEAAGPEQQRQPAASTVNALSASQEGISCAQFFCRELINVWTQLSIRICTEGVWCPLRIKSERFLAATALLYWLAAAWVGGVLVPWQTAAYGVEVYQAATNAGLLVVLVGGFLLFPIVGTAGVSSGVQGNALSMFRGMWRTAAPFLFTVILCGSFSHSLGIAVVRSRAETLSNVSMANLPVWRSQLPTVAAVRLTDGAVATSVQDADSWTNFGTSINKHAVKSTVWSWAVAPVFQSAECARWAEQGGADEPLDAKLPSPRTLCPVLLVAIQSRHAERGDPVPQTVRTPRFRLPGADGLGEAMCWRGFAGGLCVARPQKGPRTFCFARTLIGLGQTPLHDAAAAPAVAAATARCEMVRSCVRMLERHQLSPVSVCEDLDAYVELLTGAEDLGADVYGKAAGFGGLTLLLLGMMVRCATVTRAEAEAEARLQRQLEA